MLDFNKEPWGAGLSPLLNMNEQGSLAPGGRPTTHGAPDLGHCDRESREMEGTWVLDDTVDSLHS